MTIDTKDMWEENVSFNALFCYFIIGLIIITKRDELNIFNCT